MAKNFDNKLNIQEAIKAFARDDISQAGINLFSVLGYDTSLQAPLDSKTYTEFKENYIDNSPHSDRFNEEKALVNNWQSIDILFQLTDDSFTGQQQLFDSKLNPVNPQSYLCFAIELKEIEYSKTQIAGVTREVNKLFPIPILIIFKYGSNLTLAVINRRVNKKDSDRDVLEKVTLIKDIIFEKPHRAHIEILHDMSFEQLESQAKFAVTNFTLLHKAWSIVLDTQTLNKRFYTELSNWYFWAIKTVVYPGYEIEAERNGLFTKEEKLREHNAKNLIRLLTRLLFVWFIKEKDLVPEDLFDEQKIKDIITIFNPEYNSQEDSNAPELTSIYYKAILQNLFFASLNAEQGNRAFRIDGKNQNATSLMRYQRFHKNSDDFIKLIESKVPFMNGGLFECLDHQDDEKKGKQGGALVNYEDGFSDRKDNKLFIPDYIFFGKDIKVDLSKEYDDKKKKDSTVNGIINILQRYKFTIAENTPVEEDIALDPELLGRVFENLLASYNPETKTNARKQTGSFYTPRPIVEYMVDESLKAYLKTKIKSTYFSHKDLEDNTKTVEEFETSLNAKLDTLVSYNELEPDFTQEECYQILHYIDECKILDPACGSGAFPMGILQKIVYVIHKLDPQNDSWRQIQIQKISNDTKLSPKEKNELQKEILSVFDDNELDYARKLYLIENCIHGVDIQPIATQISRLRFFISLIVDQSVDSTKPNFGVRPLPNLENRFVTANTLIGLNDETVTLFDKDIEPLMTRLQKVRHNLFNAKSPKYKFKLRQEDKAIRVEMEKTLINLGFGQKNAKLISSWDPYDKNKSSEFFDAEWMFGIKDGFDIVIGNPPYVQVKKGIVIKEQYPYSEGKDVGKQNLYKLFVEASYNYLKQGGISTLIVQSSLMCDMSSAFTRELLLTKTVLLQIIEFPKVAPHENSQVFKAVLQGTCISIFMKKTPNANTEFGISINNDTSTINYLDYESAKQFALKEYFSSRYEIPLIKKGEMNIISKVKDNQKLEKMISDSLQGNINTIYLKDIQSNEKTDIFIAKGANVHKYYIDNDVFFGKKSLQVKNLVKRNYDAGAVLVTQNITGTTDKFRIHAAYAECKNTNFVFLHSVNILYLPNPSFAKFVLALLNSKLLDWLFRKTSTNNHCNMYELVDLPIPSATPAQQQSIIDLVDKILATKNADANCDTSELEHEIDELVYKLYGLTDEEIAIVEGR